MSVKKQKTVLVIGKNGQLARAIAKVREDFPKLDIRFSEREVLDLSSHQSIDRYFANNCYDLIINAAGYTEVDRAESEPKLVEQINHLAVRRLSEIALQQNSALIHVSTDYVFDGEQNIPIREEDEVNPISVYGESKLKGEQAMLMIAPRGCIIRTSWLYSEFGRNFVKTMLRCAQERDSLNVVVDQIGSPTYAIDLARTLLTIAQSDILVHSEILQIYHYANEGVCSWYDFAKAIFQITEIDCNVNPTVSDQYPSVAKRPHYSVFCKEKIKRQYGVSIRYWRDALEECLQEIR